MKRKLTKTEYEALPEALKAEYEEKNGNYLAKIEDEDDAVNAVKQAKENEVNAHKETKAKLKELERKMEELTGEKNRKDGNVEAIEKSWKEKYDTKESELTGENSKLKNHLVDSAKDSLLTTFAGKLAKSDSQRLFKLAIADRIAVEFDGEKIVHRILDKDHKPSAMTFDDFEKEIVANKEFSSILVGSKASGAGGLEPNKIGAGGLHRNNEEKPINLATLNPNELAARITAAKQS